MALLSFLENHPNEQIKETFSKWNNIKREIAKLDQFKHEGDQKAYLDSLKIVGEEYERALNSLTKIAASKKETWKDIAAVLKPGEVAIEIIRIKSFDFRTNKFNDSTSQYVALLIDENTVDYPKYIRLGNGFEMDTKHFNSYKNKMKFKLQDTDSYGIYWKLISEELVNYSKAYVSSDGVYHLINLNSLYNPETEQYVINEASIQILGNTRELLDSKIKSQPKEAVLFGFPSFNTKPDASSSDQLRTSLFKELFTTGVSELPGTKVEVDNIQSMFTKGGINARTFMANRADEQQLKNISSTDILHIATHGFFEESSDDVINNDPLLYSGLLLANIKESTAITEENGILTAKEVAQLNLHGTQLVVLSACETGKGKVADGEGVYGLQRAFQVAGATNVIISLWKVDDQATQQLLTLFYEAYLQSNDAHAALRKAQISLQTSYPHPNYWGAFYVIGG